jgi:hypothetical protein
VNAAQTLDMNKSDFQRAAGGKKVKFTFSILLVKGRIRGLDNPPPLAKDLAAALQQDDTTNSFIRENELEISMNSDFQLLIKNITPEADPEPKIEETALATEDKRDNSPGGSE